MQICNNLEISAITLLLQIQMILPTLTYIDVLNYSGVKYQPVQIKILVWQDPRGTLNRNYSHQNAE